MIVATSDGALSLEEVQLPGKRAQTGRDLVNSGRLNKGVTLGLET